MTGNFVLTRSSGIVNDDFFEEPVIRAVKRFYRDMEMVFGRPGDDGEAGNGDCQEEDDRQENGCSRMILRRTQAAPEQYRITVGENQELYIEAAEELGIIYGLNFLSRQYLGILPFWFWNDQKIEKRREIKIPAGIVNSKPRPVRYRGWFINDEVLISHWDAGESEAYPWEMAFEALLRCGGNLVVPGTDRNSKKYEKLAAGMGLWITHHHAEPLGAEMFARAYPDKNPSYKEFPELFLGLWEEGVRRQKDYKVVWNVGFRGQGDMPFWAQDPFYDTPRKRGELITSILERQCEVVRKYVDSPVFCTNLYGEVMELYQQGYLQLPKDVIMIWADNGYGKMVTRRQGNHNPRIPALPAENAADQSHGTYYHVSFYDLQAANHITMLPNSMEFVEGELKEAYDRGIQTLWLVNSSNVKPHVYPLDFIANLWNGEGKSAKAHRKDYLTTYYLSNRSAEETVSLLPRMEKCLEDYFQAMLQFGPHEDEHAGEQFYNYVTRELACCWMKDGGNAACNGLRWCIPAESLGEQVRWYQGLCQNGQEALIRLLGQCESLAEKAGRLWQDSLLLQVRIHAGCLRGAGAFCKAFEAFQDTDYLHAFYLLGNAAEWYQEAVAAMEECSHDKWRGFYENECLTDVKETAYLLGRLMSCVRVVGDGPHFYHWQREVMYSAEDRRVVLITNMENHMTDEALYAAMKKKKAEMASNNIV